ncbi:hypothetical protein [Desulfobacter sp.]|uniref:hypothetical protein n=1 Tax=Desulfobacter sp. TaxID=2294 RepID=UPI003D0B27A3
MSTETLKPELFTYQQVSSFRDEMDYHNWSLKAFGALLEYANLERFSDDFKDAGEYRGGLNGIVEMITERQEKMVDDLVEKYDRSPEHIIRAAANTCEWHRQGAYKSPADALNDIDQAIKKLDAVIENFGDEYPRASQFKTELLAHRQAISISAQYQDMPIKEAG